MAQGVVLYLLVSDAASCFEVEGRRGPKSLGPGQSPFKLSGDSLLVPNLGVPVDGC